MVIAALLHDIGHLLQDDPSRMSEIGAVDHEKTGADFLSAAGFSDRVVTLVQGHSRPFGRAQATLDIIQDRVTLRYTVDHVVRARLP